MVVPSGRRHIAVVFLMLCASIARVQAQDANEVWLKAAFLFNFARFTDWPSDVLHVGDDVDLDVRGALAAGCRAMLLDPAGGPAPEGVSVLRRLRELPESL